MYDFQYELVILIRVTQQYFSKKNREVKRFHQIFFKVFFKNEFSDSSYNSYYCVTITFLFHTIKQETLANTKASMIIPENAIKNQMLLRASISVLLI